MLVVSLRHEVNQLKAWLPSSCPRRPVGSQKLQEAGVCLFLVGWGLITTTLLGPGHPSRLRPCLEAGADALLVGPSSQPRDGVQELHQHLPRWCGKQGLRHARRPRVAGRAFRRGGPPERGQAGQRRRKRCLGRAAAAEGGGGLAAAGGRRGALMNGQLRRPEQLSGRAGVAGPAPHAGGPFPQPLTSPRES